MREFENTDEHIVTLASAGFPQTQICRILGISRRQLERRLSRNPKLKERIRDQRESLLESIQTKAVHVARKAYDVVEEIMTNPRTSEKSRLDCCKLALQCVTNWKFAGTFSEGQLERPLVNINLAEFSREEVRDVLHRHVIEHQAG